MADVVFDGVSVAYGQRTAVSGFTDAVGSGDWLGVIGPNGAGKSSLLRAIAGLAGFAGDISVDGTPLRHLDERERARLIAYVPQEPFSQSMLFFPMALWDEAIKAGHVFYRGNRNKEDKVLYPRGTS